MCTDSAHVKNRIATEKEDLVLTTSPNGRYRGLYPVAQPGTFVDREPAMVCFVRHTKAVILDVQFDSRYVPMSSAIDQWTGKKNVEVTLLAARYAHLQVRFPDGTITYMVHMARGTRVQVGMPVITGNDGVAKVEEAIKEATSVPALDQKVDA